MIKSDFGLLKSKCCLILCIHQQETCNLSRHLLLRHVLLFFSFDLLPCYLGSREGLRRVVARQMPSNRVTTEARVVKVTSVVRNGCAFLVCFLSSTWRV
jgi:hypothetical protein